MKNNVTLYFTRKPSDISTLWQAYRSRKSMFQGIDKIPEIHVKRSDFRIDASHLGEFNAICGIDQTQGLHILYPFTLVYPYLMRILCRNEMPFSHFKILNTRNRIIMFRTIIADELINIDCYNSASRITPKGLEIDFKAEVYSGTEKVWEITVTYLNRGRYGNAGPDYKDPALETPGNLSVVNAWYLEAKNRFRFGRISGDTNGIHYGSFYARMFGFKRDFAQPIRIITKCISELPGQIADKPAELIFFLKGPVYYENMLTLKNQASGNINRFDLFCRGNDRPCISGRLALC